MIKVPPSINTYCMLVRTRNSAVASSRIDISVIGVCAPLRRHTRTVKISISDSRGAQPVTVKRRADALNEHAANVIPDGTFWNFNEDFQPLSDVFPSAMPFWGIDRRLLRRNFKTDYCETSKIFCCERKRAAALSMICACARACMRACKRARARVYVMY